MVHAAQPKHRMAEVWVANGNGSSLVLFSFGPKSQAGPPETDPKFEDVKVGSRWEV